MKKVFALFSLAVVLGVTALAQTSAFSKAAYCSNCCQDKCGQTLLPGWLHR